MSIRRSVVEWDAKRVLIGAGARALFYPTLLYNVVRNKIQPEFRWWDRVDEAVQEFYYLKVNKVGSHSHIADLFFRTSDSSAAAPSRDLVAFDDGSVEVVTEADLDGYDMTKVFESGALGSTIWADISVVYRVRVAGEAALARISCLWLRCQAQKLGRESSCLGLGGTISVDIHVH